MYSVLHCTMFLEDQVTTFLQELDLTIDGLLTLHQRLDFHAMYIYRNQLDLIEGGRQAHGDF